MGYDWGDIDQRFEHSSGRPEGRERQETFGGTMTRTIALSALHAALAFLLAPVVLLTVAYSTFGLSSDDQLSWLGSGPIFSIVGAWAPVLLTPVVAVGTGIRAMRSAPSIWSIHLMGMATSVVLTFLPYLSFTAPTFSGG